MTHQNINRISFGRPRWGVVFFLRGLFGIVSEYLLSSHFCRFWLTRSSHLYPSWIACEKPKCPYSELHIDIETIYIHFSGYTNILESIIFSGTKMNDARPNRKWKIQYGYTKFQRLHLCFWDPAIQWQLWEYCTIKPEYTSTCTHDNKTIPTARHMFPDETDVSTKRI